MSTFIRYPTTVSGVTSYANLAAFPATANNGALAIALDTDILYAYNIGSISWVAIGGPPGPLSIGTLDSGTASANGAHIDTNTLVMQSASATRPGLMNTGVQSIAGAKTFTGVISASNLSGTNTGDVTLGAVGAAPSANGASLSGQVLTLQPADATRPGVLSILAQSIAGAKTFTSTISASNLSGTNTGDVTLAAVGSTPSANGASLSGQALTLQPASSTLPGVMTAGTQTVGGAKTFSTSVTSPLLSTQDMEIPTNPLNGLPTTGLISYWTFDEESGTRVDVVNAYNLTDVNGCNCVNGKIFNAANLIPGNSDYFHRAAQVWGFGNAWSISMWSLQGTAANDQGMLQFGDNIGAPSVGSEFKLVSNYLYVEDSTGAVIKHYSNIPTSDVAWIHTVVTWDGVNMLVYQDGVDITATLTKVIDDPGTLDNTSRDLFIGADANGAVASTFDGYIDGTGLWNVCLSPAQVVAVRDARPSIVQNFTNIGATQATIGVAASAGSLFADAFPGDLVIETGGTVRDSNSIFITSGISSTRSSGDLNLTTGNGDKYSGSVYISTGSAVNNDGGNVYIQTGSGGTSQGSLILNTLSLDLDYLGNLTTEGNLTVNLAGKGLKIKEGSNARMGVATLVGGTVTVSNTSVTANTRIFITVQAPGGTLGAVYVASRVAATSFTISSVSAIDTSTVAWMLVEPA